MAGVDEAGRGPLAGPVVAAAVIIERDFLETEQRGRLADINDSKQLSPSLRETCWTRLNECPHVAIGIGVAEVAEIDRLNILCASHLAMRRALEALHPAPDFALVDGLAVPGLPCPSLPIVHGDARSLSIAAASIAAKVTRDRMMEAMDQVYPLYGFARHKGYGTRAHTQALLENGPCPIHRRSFRPVREIERLRQWTDGHPPSSEAAE